MCKGRTDRQMPELHVFPQQPPPQPSTTHTDTSDQRVIGFKKCEIKKKNPEYSIHMTQLNINHHLMNLNVRKRTY